MGALNHRGLDHESSLVPVNPTIHHMNNILKRLGLIVALACAALTITSLVAPNALAWVPGYPPSPGDAYVDADGYGRSSGGDYLKTNEANQADYVTLSSAQQESLAQYYAASNQQSPTGLTNARFLGRAGWWKTPYGSPGGGVPGGGHQY